MNLRNIREEIVVWVKACASHWLFYLGRVGLSLALWGLSGWLCGVITLFLR
jgi:hypothetical protein